MKNQKELTLGEIKTAIMFAEFITGEPCELTTKQIEFDLEDEQNRVDIYKLYELSMKGIDLYLELERLKCKNSTKNPLKH